LILGPVFLTRIRHGLQLLFATNRTHIVLCIYFSSSMFPVYLDCPFMIATSVYPVFEHINDMYEVTVCDKTSPKTSCLNRTCDDCGVSKLSFCTDELDNSKTARRVTLDTNVKKYRRGNHKWTIKINWKHRRRKINT
jgi:hypothetical protein